MADLANALRFETSPYLLQHADNPVHWQPWGVAALEAARRSARPILLSVGYAACHWCHVMAHESFEDPETAGVMNSLFVNIKVDREERPDIDHIYMSALHALGEQGGWPLTMFLAPDGTPFWGGTYFPPEPRWGRPSFRQVLRAVSSAFGSGADLVRQNSAALRQALAAASAPRPGERLVPSDLDRCSAALLRLTDREQGGLRGAPKFPNPAIFRFLWHDSFRTGRTEGRDALHLLLERMSQGGIYDHLGGGYARYATDAIWLVPHFEKMLYDNAQLLELLALAQADAPNPLYAERAAETVGWMDRDMTAAADPEGNAAFAASEDADSEGEEGRFYVWSTAEIDRLLGPDAATFEQAYDVTDEGNWEGKTILRRVAGRGSDEQEAALARSREILLRARGHRVRPGRDDKVLADWNGLAITALCRAASVFGRPEWGARAALAFDFILHQMGRTDGRIEHAWRLGRVTAAGLLDDQASMIRAALALYELTSDPERLVQARRIAETAIAGFSDGSGSFYQTAADAPDVPLGDLGRSRTAADNATPSGNGMMAEIFARLFHLTGEPIWRARCEEVVRAFTGQTDQLAMMPGLLAASDFLEEGASVVIAGDPAAGAAEAALRAAALAAPDPAIVVRIAASHDSLQPDHPAFGKTAPAAGAAAYLCRRNVCGLPISDPDALRAALAHRNPP